jgi:hypothetical protein
MVVVGADLATGPDIPSLPLHDRRHRLANASLRMVGWLALKPHPMAG